MEERKKKLHIAVEEFDLRWKDLATIIGANPNPMIYHMPRAAAAGTMN